MKSGGKKSKKAKPSLAVVRPGFVPDLKFVEEIYPDILFESLRAIILTLEEKDSYTHGHSLRVAEYSVLIAQELNLSEIEVREVELSALFHDIGKIGIPDNVLLKPARLSRAEFEIMKSHPVRSARILEKVSALRNLIPGIKYHHERYDGLGYPEGLSGNDIPLYARIILIADTYDAMTSTRPYRLALDKEIAFTELRSCSHTQFDPVLVEAFITAMRKQDKGLRNTKPGMSKKIA
ncbi:MAG TPA: HD-GYP domain-containing protein [Bdellovibrionota bacterium]|jgi:putative nucleotidyltransferase with HDIG domain